MRIVWAEILLSYVVVLGDSIMDINGKRFFQSKKELRETLCPLGLTVKNNKIVLLNK